MIVCKTSRNLREPSFESLDRIPPGWDRATLVHYLTNNTPHLVTVAVFLLLLLTGLIVRGLQFKGGSGRGSEEFLLLVIGRCENTIWRQEPSAHDCSSLWTRNQSLSLFPDTSDVSSSHNTPQVSYIQGGPKKSVLSKNENRPWWGFFEEKKP